MIVAKSSHEFKRNVGRGELRGKEFGFSEGTSFVYEVEVWVAVG